MANSDDTAKGGLFDGTPGVVTQAPNVAAQPNGSTPASRDGGFFGGQTSQTPAPAGGTISQGTTVAPSNGGLFGGQVTTSEPTTGGVPSIDGHTEDTSRGGLFDSNIAAGIEIIRGQTGRQGLTGLMGNPGRDGTQVTANPEGTDGVDLTRVGIDGVNFNIASGGSDVVPDRCITDTDPLVDNETRYDASNRQFNEYAGFLMESNSANTNPAGSVVIQGIGLDLSKGSLDLAEHPRGLEIGA